MIHYAGVNRIAEYNATSSGAPTLLREYLWLGPQPVSVIEGGVIYSVRADNINRPVFATNPAGTKVWTASYSPFGTVVATTGTPINLRFPGQWFQLEAGLNQNWMRDYDPTTGRYLQVDPLGLVDGASVYGYAGNSPLRWVDPTGSSVNFGVGDDAIIEHNKGDQVCQSGDLQSCRDRCYPLLERSLPFPGSDKNTWDFNKCWRLCDDLFGRG